MAIVINGSGTVTGLAVGGLPDGTVDAGTLATNSVDSAELIDGAVDDSHIGALAATKLTGDIASARLASVPAGNLTGTVADARISALTASKLSGTVAAARMPAGSVLQVVSSTANRAAATTSTSYAATGVTASITPSSTSSKILATYHSGLCYQDHAVGWYGHFSIFRGSTNLGAGDGLSGMYIHTQSANDLGFNVSCEVLDSPSSTSSVTYTVQWYTNNTSARMVHDLSGRSTITLMEIAG